MSLDKVVAVFDTTDVPKAGADQEDEDVEALMKELYDETENTKDWCKFQGVDADEDMLGPVEQQVEMEEYVEECGDELLEYDDYYDRNRANLEPEGIKPRINQAPLQEGSFLGFLEQSAAGKHENFKGYDAPARGWTEELRKTAEFAAANVDAFTSGGLSGLTKSKKVDEKIQSATRLLAYAVMIISVITLLAKMTAPRDDVAENAMTAASKSLSDLKAVESSKLDATGEFTAIDEEPRYSIAERMHMKHMSEQWLKSRSGEQSGNDETAVRDDDEKEDLSAKKELDDIKKLLEYAKSLERRSEAGGEINEEAKVILEAAKSLAAKQLQEQKSKRQMDKDLDDQGQDDLQQSAQEKAKNDALKMLKENSINGNNADIENQVSDGLSEAASKTKADRATAVEARKNKEADDQEEDTQKSAEEEDDRQTEDEKQRLAEKKKQDAEDDRMMEIARQKVAKAKFRDEQQRKVEEAAPDTNAECGAWARMGECQANAAWMLDNCAQSCAEHAAANDDQDPRCREWADGGECENNAIYMTHHCPATCGVNAPAPAAADNSGGHARAKRAAKLNKKMKAQQAKDSSKSYIVRGKGLSKAADEVLDEHDNLQWHGRGKHGHVEHRSKDEENLLDSLSSVPEG